MCNFSEGIFDRGVEYGREQGKEQGDAGRMVMTVENLMKNLPLSLDNACAAMGITITQYQEAQQHLA